MGCSGKYILAGRQLLNRSKALEFGRIDDGRMRRGNQNIAVDFVANHAVSTVHDDSPASRVFIALLGNGEKHHEDNA